MGRCQPGSRVAKCPAAVCLNAADFSGGRVQNLITPQQIRPAASAVHFLPPIMKPCSLSLAPLMAPLPLVNPDYPVWTVGEHRRIHGHPPRAGEKVRESRTERTCSWLNKSPALLSLESVAAPSPQRQSRADPDEGRRVHGAATIRMNIELRGASG